MATFVNNLRLKEITTGDEDGTWGSSTNTNLELITDAFGSGTIQLAADANETFTMDDGAADATRALVLDVTSAGSLTATRTVTLAPNTVNKVWVIKNSTTGGQAIEISQGSGANVTVANGETKAVYGDGNGSGAAVTDFLAGLVIGGAFGVEGAVTLESTLDITGATTLVNLTSTGTVDFSGATVSDGGTVTTIDINGGTMDGVVIGGSTPAAATVTNLTASGTVSFSGATVSNLGTVTTADINGGTLDGVVIGGASAAAATVTNLTASGTVNFTGATVSNLGTVTTADINGGTLDGVVIGGASAAAGTFTTIAGSSLDVSGNVDGAGSHFSRSGTTASLSSGSSETLFAGEDSSVYLVSALDNADNADFRAVYVVVFGANTGNAVRVTSLQNDNYTMSWTGSGQNLQLTNGSATGSAAKWKAVRLL